MTVADHELARRLLDVIEHDIVPLTREGVERGDKIFGAAVLRKSDRSLVIAGTNREFDNPLFHGEVATLNAYFAMPEAGRPPPGDCLFLSTHEPCSLCLSAITWAGFDNFNYLFGYVDTRDAFNIPHDLRILSEVFRIRNGDYERHNSYWTSRSIAELAEGGPDDIARQMERLDGIYAGLSAAYQESKGSSNIPLD